MSRDEQLSALPVAQQELAQSLKQLGVATIAELAQKLGLSTEGVRQRLLQLERRGFVEAERAAPSEQGGRPAMLYRLSIAGEHLFPKSYDDLVIALIDTVRDELGSAGLMRVLETITDRRARALESRVQGLPLEERIEVVREAYAPDDSYMEVTPTDDGYLLVERNCPFLNVALARPALCSSTVCMLRRLLQVRVSREARFQRGDGRCVFRVWKHQRLPREEAQRFELESGAEQPAR